MEARLVVRVVDLQGAPYPFDYVFDAAEGGILRFEIFDINPAGINRDEINLKFVVIKCVLLAEEFKPPGPDDTSKIEVAVLADIHFTIFRKDGHILGVG